MAIGALVDIAARAAADWHASQFEPQKFFEVAQRTSDWFVVQWRTRGAVLLPSGSLPAALAKIDVKRSGEPDQR